MVFEETPVDFLFPVQAGQSTADSEIAEADHVWPLERENQEHLRGPKADVFQRGQPVDNFLIWGGFEFGEVKLPVLNFADKRSDGIRFAFRDAGATKVFNAGVA